MPAAAAIPLALSAYQAYKGFEQEKKAKNLKESNFVPGSVRESVASGRMGVNASNPAVTRGLARLKASSANTIDARKRIGGSAAQIQNTVTDVDAREKEAVKDLQVADASFKIDQQRNLEDLLREKGYYEKASRDAFNAGKSALIGASEQNKYNALSTAAEGLIMAAPNSAFDANSTTKSMATSGAPPASTSVEMSTKSPVGSRPYSNLSPEQYRRLVAAGLIKEDPRFPQYSRVNMNF